MESMVTGAEFWHGKRVFLTGHTGFKGSWLAILLGRWGADVHGLALSPPEGSIFTSAHVSEMLASSTIGDIRTLDTVVDALKRSEAEIVFHLAAQPLVRTSYDVPVETYATNVMGTVHVLEAVRRASSVRAVVIVTTDKCYENREWEWGYREDEPVGGYDPYSSSKGCSELVTSAYRRSFLTARGIGVASGRAGNVVGGGDYSEDRLIPDLIRALRREEAAIIRNAGAIRPWQHVLEAITGYVLLAERLCGSDNGRFSDAWNFGPDVSGEKSVRDVAETICAIWGDRASWQEARDGSLHEATFLKLDSSKARRYLGWKPRWSFEDTMRATIDWYLADQNSHDMLAFSQHQIAEYLEPSS